ncbi:MAG: DUF4347 domain-containing protein [Verrucomicrobiales bacterium]|nr:DUF4347 domain-containing protein [Verrucomicrobiales bacterium]
MKSVQKDTFVLEVLEPRVLLSSDGLVAAPLPSAAAPETILAESLSFDLAASRTDRDLAGQSNVDLFEGMDLGALSPFDSDAESQTDDNLRNLGTAADPILHPPDHGTYAVIEGDSASDKLKLRSTNGSFAETSQILFVDAGVLDHESLIDPLNLTAAAAKGIEVVMLDPDLDGLSQISDVLSLHRGLAAVQILSHSSRGSLQLGSAALSEGNLEDYAGMLRGWGQALAENGDLLLYGCSLANGETAAQFVTDLAALTGADVAASIDDTGRAALGGNWVLEYRTGEIDARSWFGTATPSYDGLLSGPVFIAQAADLLTTQTIPLGPQIKTLDLHGIDKNLLVTVTETIAASNPAKQGIKVQEMDPDTGIGSGPVVTYEINSVSGKVDGLVLGHAGKRVKLVLEGDVNTLDLSSVDEVRVAVGTDETKTFNWLTQPAPGATQGVAIFKKSTGALETLKIGLSGSALATDLYLDEPRNLFTELAKGPSYNGKLKLHYPEASSSSSPETIVDLVTSTISGFTRLTGFDKTSIQSIETRGGQQEIKVSDVSSVKLETGTEDDVLEAGANNQTLEGGRGDDRYVFGNDWGEDTVTEVDTVTDRDTGDHLDFSRVDAGITVNVYSSELPSGPPGPALGQKGLQVAQTDPPSAANKLVDAASVEKVSGGKGTNTYVFHDNWGYFSTTDPTPPTATFTIVDAIIPTDYPAKHKTLDFSDVGHDLLFELDATGVGRSAATGDVTVTANVRVTTPTGDKSYKYVVKAKGITDIVGGKGTNTYQILKHDALLGQITTPATPPGGPAIRNILDYSRYLAAQAVVVNGPINRFATGLKFDDGLAKKEQQIVTISNAASGTFTLKLASLETTPIEYSTNADETRDAIRAALNAFGAGLFTVTTVSSGADKQWQSEFTIEANHPDFDIDPAKLLTAADQPLPAGSANVSTPVGGDGAPPAGVNGIDRIDNIVAPANNTTHMVLFNATTATGADVVYLGAGNGTVAGSGRSDLLIGAAGNDALSGEAGDDFIAGGAGTDTIDGKDGNDILLGGAGTDIVRGGPGNDRVEGGDGDDTLSGDAGADQLKGGAGNDTLRGGTDNDTYVLEDNWGVDTIVEKKTGGGDTLDLSGVEQNVQYVLSNGELKVGTSTPLLTNQPTTLQGWREVNGTFNGANTATIARLGNFNEVQVLTLGGPTAGTTFTLELVNPGSAIAFGPQTITVGTTDKLTRAAIQTALNTALGSNGAVKVTQEGASTFAIEFTTPSNTNLPTIVLDPAGLTWPSPPPVEQVQAAATAVNAKFSLDLKNATGGTFGLTFSIPDGKREATNIPVDANDTVTAGNIKGKLDSLIGVTTEVTVEGPVGSHKFNILFTSPAGTNVTGFALTSANTLTYSTPPAVPPVVATVDAGTAAANAIFLLDLGTATGGSFVLNVSRTGGAATLTTASIDVDTDSNVTAQRIATKLNALDGGSTVATVVTVAGLNSFNIEFTAPATVSGLTVAPSPPLTYSAGLFPLQEGQSGNELQRLTIKNADSGSFTLKIGDRQTAAIAYTGVVANLATSIQSSINNLRQEGLSSLFHYKAVVKGSVVAGGFAFDIEFQAPEEKDVPEISINPASLVASGGLTI